MSHPENPNGVAVVCVAFDDEMPALVANAITLAENTGVQLRFVSVLESFHDKAWVVDTPMYGLSSALFMRLQEKARAERTLQMQTLIAGMPPGLIVSSAILTGEVAEAIVFDASAHAANFIMTAANTEHQSAFVPNGVSVALRLMAEAPMPVLVTSRTRPLRFEAKPFTILLADDLQPTSEEAARKAFELAAFIGPCLVRHVHIHGDFREVLKDTWVDLKAQHPALRGTAESSEDLLREEYEARLTALKGRGGTMRGEATEAGAKIELDIRTGSVAKNLLEEIEETSPDLVVFGRHRALKAKPFLIGRMSFRAMLVSRRPLLLVPPHDQLYAPMPFPARRK